jgi:hypothetical protein
MIIMIIFGGFYLNNGFTGAYFDGCLIRTENTYTFDDYYPYTDGNGVDQLVPIVLYKHNLSGSSDLSWKHGWGWIMEKENHGAVSFLGWQCDQWKEKLEEYREVQKQPEIIILSNEDKIQAVFEPFVTAQDYWDVSHECKETSRSVEHLACNIKGIGLLSIPTDILLTTFEDDELLFCKLFDEATRTKSNPMDSLLPFYMDQSQKQEICISALGIALMDLSICDKSKTTGECYYVIAIKSDIVTLNECNTLKKGIGLCYMGVAGRTQNSKICEFDEGDHVEFSKEYNYKNNCLKSIIYQSISK